MIEKFLIMLEVFHTKLEKKMQKEYNKFKDSQQKMISESDFEKAM